MTSPDSVTWGVATASYQMDNFEWQFDDDWCAAGLPDFARTRKFYAMCGYEEEARIRDYFAPGDDMVLFRKVLNTV